MKNIDIQYSFTNKDFRKRLLRHIRIIYFITVPMVMIYIVTWVIMILNAYKNNQLATICGVITIIFLLGSSNCLFFYQILYRNRLITARNFAYEHNVMIENNYVKLTLKANNSSNSEYYEFPITKIKKEGDSYLIFKNRNNFIYVPAKYIDER